MASPSLAPPLSRADKTKCSDKKASPPKNIAAIDFGTTSLTLSYLTTGDKDVVTLPFGAKSDSRIPNAILLQRDCEGSCKCTVSAIGKTARQNFTRLRPDERMEFIYFERIKMLLKRDKGFDREAYVTSFSGESFYLIEVIAFILKKLALELQGHLKDTATPWKKSDFDWVITVPAIWDAKGKRLMRESAFLSGILTKDEGITQLTPYIAGIPPPKEINPEKLSLALEPECAAIYSQKLCKDKAKRSGEAAVKVSKGYLVIDAGGGTIDITAQVDVKGGVKVVSVPTGSVMGGTQVNEKFSKIFQKIVQDESFAKFCLKGKNNSEITSRRVICDNFLYDEFELQKISFGKGEIIKGEMAIEVPSKFISFYGPEAIKKGAESIPGYEFEDDTIYIKKEAAEDLFSDCISAIIASAKAALDSLKKGQIDTIYLVGGFGSSQLVQNHVIKALECDIKVLVPDTPILAIATGAVEWRKNTEVIQARCLDATYGIAISDEFDKKKHNPAYKVTNKVDRKDYCKDIFEVFVLKGEQVDSNDEFVSNLRAAPSENGQVVTLTLYTTQDDGVQYVKAPNGEPLAQPIGQLLIEVPKLPENKRSIEVRLNFSGTEIQAKATYYITKDTKKTVGTVCDFLSAVSHI